MEYMNTNRRSFLKQGSAITLGALPSVVYFGASAATAASRTGEGRILVIVQMSGGNDGINTVVPYTDEGYAKHRSQLRLPTDALLKITDTIGLHPSMKEAAKLYEDGRLAIVQGVGYPNPHRSHDTSMAIWHSGIIGDEETLRTHGWLGRTMDEMKEDPSTPVAGNSRDPQMIFLGNESQPLALQSRRSMSVTLNGLSDLRLRSPWSVEQSSTTNDLHQFVQQEMKNAAVMAQSIAAASPKHLADGNGYPASQLGQRLRSVSALIKTGLTTPVYYTIQDGYDTHAVQMPIHTTLLEEFGKAIAAFIEDMQAAGLADRVCVMGFSEFGRRVAENSSAGTDHGTSGPVFLAGQRVRGGLIGNTPSLFDLDDGDLRTSIDFRDVYRELLTSWMNTRPDGILGPASASPLQLFKL